MSHATKNTFHRLYCETRGCRGERFVRAVFWESLHLHAIFLMPVLFFFSRRYFEPDLDLIKAVSDAETLEQVNEEIRHYITDYRNQAWMRRSLHVRLSTHKLRRVAYEFLPRKADGRAPRRPRPEDPLPPSNVIQRRTT